MNIRLAATEAELEACYPVMKELRSDYSCDDFVSKVRELQDDGYQLAYLAVDERPVAAAGFRFGESLAWKRYLYVDDLVTLASERSKGYGAALLDWLTAYAAAEGCEQLHLDSGVQREDAHRFYQREGMRMLACHFTKYVKPGPGSATGG
jgi:GNAT superfamily N-acetyltransferase